MGGREDNVFNLLIDCGLLAIYYLLIINRSNFLWIIGGYALIFLLYFLWEYIRVSETKSKMVNSAANANLIFFFAVLIVYLFFMLGDKYNYVDIEHWKPLVIICLYIVLFSYRFFIHGIYKRSYGRTRILIDIDGVACEHAKAICERVNQDF